MIDCRQCAMSCFCRLVAESIARFIRDCQQIQIPALFSNTHHYQTLPPTPPPPPPPPPKRHHHYAHAFSNSRTYARNSLLRLRSTRYSTRQTHVYSTTMVVTTLLQRAPTTSPRLQRAKAKLARASAKLPAPRPRDHLSRRLNSPKKRGRKHGLTRSSSANAKPAPAVSRNRGN